MVVMLLAKLICSAFLDESVLFLSVFTFWALFSWFFAPGYPQVHYRRCYLEKHPAKLAFSLQVRGRDFYNVLFWCHILDFFVWLWLFSLHAVLFDWSWEFLKGFCRLKHTLLGILRILLHSSRHHLDLYIRCVWREYIFMSIFHMFFFFFDQIKRNEMRLCMCM